MPIFGLNGSAGGQPAALVSPRSVAGCQPAAVISPFWVSKVLRAANPQPHEPILSLKGLAIRGFGVSGVSKGRLPTHTSCQPLFNLKDSACCLPGLPATHVSPSWVSKGPAGCQPSDLASPLSSPRHCGLSSRSSRGSILDFKGLCGLLPQLLNQSWISEGPRVRAAFQTILQAANPQLLRTHLGSQRLYGCRPAALVSPSWVS